MNTKLSAIRGTARPQAARVRTSGGRLVVAVTNKVAALYDVVTGGLTRAVTVNSFLWDRVWLGATLIRWGPEITWSESSPE